MTLRIDEPSLLELNGTSWVLLGRVLGAHGLLGDVRIRLYNSDALSLSKGMKVALVSPTHTQTITLTKVSALRLGSVEITDRDGAQACAGMRIYASREALPKLENDEVYLVDLLNFAVHDLDQKPLGKLEGFSDNSAQLLGHLRRDNDEVTLVPLVPPILAGIDQDKGIVTLDLPEGL